MNRRELKRLCRDLDLVIVDGSKHLRILDEYGRQVAAVSKGTGGYRRGSRAQRNLRAALKRSTQRREEVMRVESNKTVTLTENEWNSFFGFVNRCLEQHGEEADPLTYGAIESAAGQLDISTTVGLKSSAAVKG